MQNHMFSARPKATETMPTMTLSRMGKQSLVCDCGVGTAKKKAGGLPPSSSTSTLMHIDGGGPEHERSHAGHRPHIRALRVFDAKTHFEIKTASRYTEACLEAPVSRLNFPSIDGTKVVEAKWLTGTSNWISVSRQRER